MRGPANNLQIACVIALAIVASVLLAKLAGTGEEFYIVSGEEEAATEWELRSGEQVEVSDLYVYNHETESLVDSGCDTDGDQIFCLEDRDRSLDYDWHLNLPCPPMVKDPLSISAAGTVLYRLSAEEYAEACEE